MTAMPREAEKPTVTTDGNGAAAPTGERKRASLVEGFFDPNSGGAAIFSMSPEQMKEIDVGDDKGSQSQLAGGNHGANFIEFLLLGCCCAVPPSLLVYYFSGVGVGFETYSFLVTQSAMGSNLLALGFLLLFLLYILDFSRFSKIPKIIVGTLVCYLLFLSAFLKAKTHPQGAIIVLMFHTPILLGILRLTVSKTTYKAHFYNGIAFCCFLCGICSITIWMMWLGGMLSEHSYMWSTETKARLIAKSSDIYEEWGYDHEKDCGMDKVMEDENGVQYPKEYLLKRAKACAAIQTTWYLIWISPMVACGINMIIALFCYLRGKYLESPGCTRTESTLKLTVIFFAMLTMGMWIAASVAGASMRLAGTLMGFIMGGILALFVWLYFELGHDNLIAASRNSNLVRSVLKFAMSDWARAIFICFANMFIPLAMLVNMFNQCVRRIRGWPSTGTPFTENFAKLVKNMKDWNWSSILSKVNILCIVYFVLMVGVAKATYIFLSWLNGQLQSVDAGLVIIIFYCIGYLMFMLPPVPGVPVYITGGIILSARMESVPSIGFWGGTLMALGVGYSLKLSAVAGQWSIGKLMGKSVKIQKMVGVDTVGIRAIEDILKVDGVSFAKISVLVGGPDWPTSVLCGILKLKCWKCVVGTMPCIFIAAPCVLVGAFLLQAGKEQAAGKGGSWGAIAGTTLCVATLGQSGAMMIAAYYMSEVMNQKGEELAKPRPEHKPIEDMTKAEAHFVATYNEVTRWKDMPGWSKGLLGLGTFVMLAATCVLVLMDVSCFRPFSLTSKIEDPIHEGGLDGNVLEIFLPLGVMACLMFAIACMLFKCWSSWATSETKRRVSTTKVVPVADSDPVVPA